MCIFGRARASSLVETTEKKVSRGGVKKNPTNNQTQVGLWECQALFKA